MTTNHLEAEAYQKDESFSKVSSVMKMTRRGSVRFKGNLLRKSSSAGTDQKKQLKKSRSVKKYSSLGGGSRSSIKQVTNLHQPEWGRLLRRTPTLRILRATCSSTLKGAKFSAGDLETRPGEFGSEAGKVCTYSYCSLHGHRHASPPPLKRLISVRRRTLKSQRGLKPEAHQSGAKNNTITMEELLHGDDAISDVHDAESCSFSSASVDPPECLSDSSSNATGSVVQQEKNDALGTDCNEGELSSGKGKKNFRLWNLLYQHVVIGQSAEGERQPPLDDDDGSQQDASELGSSQNLSEPCNQTDRNLELRQSDAVKLVQQAFNKLLSEIPDDSSDDHSIASEDRNEGKEENHRQDEQRADFPDAAELRIEQESRKKQVPKRWSNLKKLIILRRFVNELSSVNKFPRPKVQNQPMEHAPEAERVRLRHQTVGGRKDSNEWMLDYALRQVISTLAPSQKRKVDLLVQAFETVIPGMDMSRLNPVGSSHRASAEATESLIPKANKKGTKVKEIRVVKTEAPETGPENHLDQVSGSPIQQSASESLTPKASSLQFYHVVASEPVLNIKTADVDLKNEEDSNLDGKQSRKPCGTGSISEDDAERCSSKKIPENGTLPNAFERGILTSVREIHSSESSLNSYQDSKHLPNERAERQGELDECVENMPGNDKPERYVCQSPPIAKTSDLIATTASLVKGSKLEKQRYTKLWYLLYKHMVSTNSEEKSHRLHGEEAKQEEGGDGVRSLLKEGNGDTLLSSTADRDTMSKLRREGHHNMEFEDEVIKLVEEAIDEIPLSDDQEAPEKNSIEGEGELITEEVPQSAVKYVHEQLNKSEDGLNTAVVGSRNNGTEKDARGVPNGENKYKSQGQKNWSNLKKLILIRRFVKSLEKVKAFNPRGPRLLPQGNTLEPEKVNLRHLDMEDRKNSDEWMLDHALQQVVAKLTPARKRRVELLVEAFETVIPTLGN